MLGQVERPYIDYSKAQRECVSRRGAEKRLGEEQLHLSRHCKLLIETSSQLWLRSLLMLVIENERLFPNLGYLWARKRICDCRDLFLTLWNNADVRPDVGNGQESIAALSTRVGLGKLRPRDSLQ